MTLTDEIRMEMVLKAPREKVWRAISTPEGWADWFTVRTEGDFQVGEILRLDFGKYGECWGEVVEREEMNSFAYKWHPGEDSALDKYPADEMTTVRFILEDHADGTKLTLIEDGFDRIPTGRRVSALKANTGGWEHELGELQVFVETGKRPENDESEIIREKFYATTREKLWSLVATPEGFKKWFVQDVVGDFVSGELATLVFNDSVRGDLKVVEVQKPERFVFRWHPGQENGCVWTDFPESEATTTTFTLTEVEGGTKLRIVESGFENVPCERRNSAFQSDSQGWNYVMTMIEEAVEEGR